MRGRPSPCISVERVPLTTEQRAGLFAGTPDEREWFRCVVEARAELEAYLRGEEWPPRDETAPGLTVIRGGLIGKPPRIQDPQYNPPHRSRK